MSKPWIVLCFVTGLALGCSTGTTSPQSTSVTPATSSFKTLIEGVANSGTIGSGAEELKTQFEELSKTDAAKAAAIKADFNALLSAEGNPAKVKQLAGEMAKKL